MTVKKTPLYILLTYIVMMLCSGIIDLAVKTILKLINPDIKKIELFHLSYGWTTFTTFLLGFLVTLFFILRDKDFFKKAFVSGKKANTSVAILWGFIGFILVLVAQLLAGAIEEKLGITAVSQNTASLSAMAAITPIIIVSIVFFGPFLEEVVFRRIIFASLNQTTNFFLAAMVSAIIFGLIHMELSHIITYVFTGLVFAFLYNKTKRLLTTILAHMLLNAFVLYIQLNEENMMHYLQTLKNIFN